MHWSLGLERRQLKGLARTTIFVCTRVCVGRLLGQERSLTDVGTNIWSAKRLRRAHPDSQEITPPFPHMGCTLAFLRVAWTWPTLHSWKRLHALQMAAGLGPQVLRATLKRRFCWETGSPRRTKKTRQERGEEDCRRCVVERAAPWTTRRNTRIALQC